MGKIINKGMIREKGKLLYADEKKEEGIYYVKKKGVWVLNKIPDNMIATGVVWNIVGQILTSKGMKTIVFQKVTWYEVG